MARYVGNRYGRSEEARRRILEGADDLVAEVGLEATTVEGIARRAGVAKQTIYRWWRDKNAVLLDVLVRDAGLRLDFPEATSLDGEVNQMCRKLTDFLIHDDAGRVLLSLRARAIVDPTFLDDFNQRFWDHQVAREQEPLRRAVRRGELPPDTDVARLRLQLLGPLYAAAEEGTLDDDFAAEHAQTMRAVMAQRSATSQP